MWKDFGKNEKIWKDWGHSVVYMIMMAAWIDDDDYQVLCAWRRTTWQLRSLQTSHNLWEGEFVLSGVFVSSPEIIIWLSAQLGSFRSPIITALSNVLPALHTRLILLFRWDFYHLRSDHGKDGDDCNYEEGESSLNILALADVETNSNKHTLWKCHGLLVMTVHQIFAWIFCLWGERRTKKKGGEIY